MAYLFPFTLFCVAMLCGLELYRVMVECRASQYHINFTYAFDLADFGKIPEHSLWPKFAGIECSEFDEFT
jgi:hypothetical protein